MTAYGEYDWDQMVGINAENVDTAIAIKAGEFYVKDGDTIYNHNSKHIIRNSANNHNWLGVLSTLNYELSRKWHLTTGIDTRRYKGEHYREVRNLLGGDYWYDSKFGAARVGDKIAYWNDGIVTYGGLLHKWNIPRAVLTHFGRNILQTHGQNVLITDILARKTLLPKVKFFQMLDTSFKLGGKIIILTRKICILQCRI